MFGRTQVFGQRFTLLTHNKGRSRKTVLKTGDITARLHRVAQPVPNASQAAEAAVSSQLGSEQDFWDAHSIQQHVTQQAFAYHTICHSAFEAGIRCVNHSSMDRRTSDVVKHVTQQACISQACELRDTCHGVNHRWRCSASLVVDTFIVDAIIGKHTLHVVLRHAAASGEHKVPILVYVFQVTYQCELINIKHSADTGISDSNLSNLLTFYMY